MPATREVFRRAIDRGAPTDEEMRVDLARLMDRLDPPDAALPALRRPRFERAAQIAGALAFAASIAAAIALRTPPTDHAPDAPAVAPPSARTTRIYIRRSDEPEAKATSFTLASVGEHRP